MAHLTREQILARKTGKGIATLPDGSTVAIRGLTRDEVMEFNESGRPARERDNYVVSTGMTGPKLSEEDVAAWGASGNAGDLVVVSAEIAALSGLLDKSAKEAMQTFRDEPGEGV